MQSALKSGYSTERTEHLRYDGAQLPLTGTPHKLLLLEADLVRSPRPHPKSNPLL
jgi:hypothetical protein